MRPLTILSFMVLTCGVVGDLAGAQVLINLPTPPRVATRAEECGSSATAAMTEARTSNPEGRVALVRYGRGRALPYDTYGPYSPYARPYSYYSNGSWNNWGPGWGWGWGRPVGFISVSHSCPRECHPKPCR
jgi:hypothetical protein